MHPNWIGISQVWFGFCDSDRPLTFDYEGEMSVSYVN